MRELVKTGIYVTVICYVAILILMTIICVITVDKLKEIESKVDTMKEYIDDFEWLQAEMDKRQPQIMRYEAPSIEITKIPAREVLITLTLTEFNDFCKVVQLEGEPSDEYDAFLAVATVIMNRMYNGSWGGTTMHEVLSASGQFSVWKNKDTANVSTNCLTACIDSTLGERNLPDNVYEFRQSQYFLVTPDMMERYKVVAIIGDNTFIVRE